MSEGLHAPPYSSTFSSSIGWRRVDAPMSAITATRTELMQRRAGIAFARQGRDLLFDKRMALVRELHQLDTDVTSELVRATTLGRQARADLDVALVEEGPEAVEGVAIGAATGIRVEREDRTVVGVRVVSVRPPQIRRQAEQRGSAPVLVAPSVIGAAEGYERFLEQVLRIVALEATVRRLTQEIARTTRQVNALENVVIPALEAEATQIAAVLDEREREEHSRLKRARDRRAEQHKTEASADAPAPHDPPTTSGPCPRDHLEDSR